MRAIFLLLATLSLSACGLRPVYGGGSQGPVRTMLAEVEVAPIPGESGWLMANALRDRIEIDGRASPRYRLDVKLDEQITGLGVRSDDSVSRERRTLRARYQLVEIGSDKVLLDATAGSDAGVDVVGSEYATIAAERSALERLSTIVADQIVARVARFALDTPPAAAP